MHFEKFTTTGVQFIFNIIFVSLNWIPACKWVYGWLVERYWCQQRFTLTFIAALKWIRWHWNRVSIILEAIDSVLHSACKIDVHFLCYFLIGWSDYPFFVQYLKHMATFFTGALLYFSHISRILATIWIVDA